MDTINPTSEPLKYDEKEGILRPVVPIRPYVTPWTYLYHILTGCRDYYGRKPGIDWRFWQWEI